MTKYISSVKNQFIKELVALKNSSKKKNENKFIIEGDDLVDMAYEAKCLDMIITLKELDKYKDVDQVVVDKMIVDKLSNNKSTSKILGIAHYDLKNELGERIIYLDRVQDPGNVGTIIRSALSFSYDAVLLSSECASIYNEKVIQASKGAVFKINVIENASLALLKENNYYIVSTSLKNAKDYREVKLESKFVLVFGNEGQGVSKDMLENSNALVKIKMNNKIDSLNVAVASGIIMNHYQK